MCNKLIGPIILVLLLGWVSASVAQEFDPNNDPDLLGWWAFEEGTGTTVADLSGNGNDGTLTNGPQWVEGYFGGGLQFDGTDDYVDTGNAEDLARWTICCWVKGAAAPASTSPTGPVHREANYQINWNHSDASFRNAAALNVGGTWYSASHGTLEADTWYHLAATYDGTSLRAYTNGALITTTSCAGTPNAETNTLKFARHAASAQYCAVTLDDVRVFTRALTDAEVKSLVPPKLKAYDPIPEDGTVGVLNPLMQWTAGDTAMFHDVYFGTTPDLTEANKVASRQMFNIYYHIPGLESGVTYYWRVDEIEMNGTTYTGNVWSFTAKPVTAFAPSPADGAAGLFPVQTLSWLPGSGAVRHQLYFGDNLADVEQGAPGTDQGILTEMAFVPPILRASTTYYWRVDEIALDDTVQTGGVWSFTTETGATGKVLREWWLSNTSAAVSGLTSDPRYPNDPSGTELVDLFEGPVDWDDNYGSRLRGWLVPPQSGDYTFWLACDNGGELWLSTDADPANVQLIASVSDWVASRDFDNATGSGGDNQESDVIPLEAGQKYYIEALMNEAGGGDNIAVAWQPPGGTREVIDAEFVDTFALPPLQAFSPDPADGAVEVVQSPTLSWSAGEKAAQHEVYFGDDEAAVATADASVAAIYKGRQSATTFNPGALEWDKTYYWRIDEINTGDPGSPWPGNVWSFTTANYIPVDDFEVYTNEVGNRVFQTWVDGLGYTEPPPGKLGNGTGALVGHDIWTPTDPHYQGLIMEVADVHGGDQAMPLYFDNSMTPFKSEADRTWTTAQNWTVNGVTDLSLWFKGAPAAFIQTAADSFTMSASGNDIWGTADAFRFVYKSLNGNGSIVARVDSIANTNAWAKGGVMIRESLDPGGKHAMVVVTPGNGVQFTWRQLMNMDMTEHNTQADLEAPHWVKLTRAGNVFTAEHSADGVTWEPVVDAASNTRDLPMIGNVYIGLALTSHNADAVTVAEFSNVTTSGGVSGQWQVAEVGGPHPANGDADFYVALEDSAGRIADVPYPGGANVADWTEWKIPLSEFSSAGVNLAAVKKMTLGVGRRTAPVADGDGMMLIDDIRVVLPAPVDPNEATVEYGL